MKFLLDAQLPPQLARWLNEAGHDALHTLHLPLGNRTPDEHVARRADADQRVLVSKDADFARGYRLHGTPRRLLIVSAGNVTNAVLIGLWQRNLVAIIDAFDRHGLVELGANELIVHE